MYYGPTFHSHNAVDNSDNHKMFCRRTENFRLSDQGAAYSARHSEITTFSFRTSDFHYAVTSLTGIGDQVTKMTADNKRASQVQALANISRSGSCKLSW